MRPRATICPPEGLLGRRDALVLDLAQRARRIMAEEYDTGAAAAAETRELTLRALVTGLAIGAVLTPCNVYSGLKIGWSFNMSIAAGLLAFGFWSTLHRAGHTAPLALRENNINQTAASASASIVSGGLVAPIPALTMLTGQTLTWFWLMVWVFLVSILGVFVAAGLREAMLVRERLPFPAGVATAETLREIHSKSMDAARRPCFSSESRAASRRWRRRPGRAAARAPAWLRVDPPQRTRREC